MRRKQPALASHFFLGEAAESAFQHRHSFAANRRTGNVAFDSKPKAWHLGQVRPLAVKRLQVLRS
jgi:hypothetical protein